MRGLAPVQQQSSKAGAEMTERFARLVLHIGQHKTGTTSLQRSLSLNRAGLASRGVLYPRLPCWRDAHHALVPALVGIEHCAVYVRRRLGRTDAKAATVSARALAKLGALAAKRSDDTLVLSTEAVFRGLPDFARERLLKTLSRLAHEVRLVCYIRHPADQYLSSLNTLAQSLRGLRPPTRQGRRRPLSGYVGREGIVLQVRPFLPSEMEEGDMVADFLVRGIGIPADDAPLRPAAPMNRTLSAEALALFIDYADRRGKPGDGALRRRDLVFREAVRLVDRWVSGYARPVLRPGFAEAVLRETSDLEWLRDVCGCVFPEVDYGIVGTGSGVDFREVTRIDQLCEVDSARLARMRRTLGWMMPPRPD